MRASLLTLVLLASMTAGCATPPADLTGQACDAGEFAKGIGSGGDLDCTDVDWDEIDGIPFGFADGTDDAAEPGTDTLADLTCVAGQVARFNGNAWACAGGNDAIHELTVISYSGAHIDAGGSNQWRKLVDVDSFTKQRGASELLVHWTGHAQTDDGGGIGKCVYELRIDDRTSRDTAPASNLEGAGAIIGETPGAVPFHVADVFDWPSAGSHDVAIWVKGNVAECFLNPGSFRHTIVIEEIG